MRFTVFGASGFIGSHLAEFIRTKDTEVFCPKRDEQININENLGNIIYCIGLTADFREKPFETIEAHVCKLKDLLQKHIFDSFTYISSTRIYIHNIGKVDEHTMIPISVNDPFDLFNSSKLTGELLTLNSRKPKTRVVRISNVIGNDFSSKNFITSIIRSALSDGKIVLRTTPYSSKDYISVDDVVKLLYHISLRGESSIYNLASGINTTNEEICKIIQEETNCTVEYANKLDTIVFPSISINKIQDEFGYHNSSSMKTMLKKMITSFKTSENES